MKIKYDEQGIPDESTLPPFGERVLGCTVRLTPLPTNVVYDAYRDAGFTEGQRNESLSAILAGHGEHPTKVLKALEKHPREATRSPLIEMYRLKQEDRQQSQQKFEGEWAWISDAKAIVPAFDEVPTHWFPLPTLDLS